MSPQQVAMAQESCSVDSVQINNPTPLVEVSHQLNTYSLKLRLARKVQLYLCTCCCRAPNLAVSRTSQQHTWTKQPMFKLKKLVLVHELLLIKTLRNWVGQKHFASFTQISNTKDKGFVPFFLLYCDKIDDAN